MFNYMPILELLLAWFGKKFNTSYCITFSDVPASAMYFGSYELIQRQLVPEGGDRSEIGVLRTLFAGGMAGVCNWLVALPPDVLKSRLQSGIIYDRNLYLLQNSCF